SAKNTERPGLTHRQRILRSEAHVKALAVTFSVVAAAAVVMEPSLAAQRGGNAPAGPPVSVTVNGRTWTQQQLFQRNIGGPDDQSTQFPPHKIVGNLYYVGTNSLAAFLLVTPQGNILINSTYERNVPVIQK